MTRKLKNPYDFYRRFPRYKEIQAYLKWLETRYPNYVAVHTIGHSYEGRSISMIILCNFNSKKKRDITLIEANIHAREWIANSTMLYFIDYVIKRPRLLNLMDFYIIPCLNPDGYEFTHKRDRLWRKNRNPNNAAALNEQGVDLNRNFPFAYGIVGSSTELSSFMYRGTRPLSEPEAQALDDVMRQYHKYIKLFLSIHAYGNAIMFPWGYTLKDTQDRPDLMKCGNACKRMIASISPTRRFKVGSFASQMYIISGSTIDHARGTYKIKFAYTIELQKFGKSGFTPKPKHISQIGFETTLGILAMVRHVIKYYKRKDCECSDSRESVATNN